MIMALVASVVGSGAFAQVAGEASLKNQHDPAQVCETVVSAERGAKPYKLCMTRAEWKAKKLADAKDANRIVCRYQEQPGTRFRSAKVCMPASEWDNERLRDRQAIEQIQMRTCVAGGGC